MSSNYKYGLFPFRIVFKWSISSSAFPWAGGTEAVALIVKYLNTCFIFYFL